MGLFSLHMFLFAVVCAFLLLGISARSTGYNYGYGQRVPPAVATNGSGRQNGRLGGGVDSSRDVDQTKGVQPQDTVKSAGPAMSAWGIIAIIMTLCLSLMGVYYFTLFYPILCKKERKYDVMDLGSQ